jgi:hypothetical protein
MTRKNCSGGDSSESGPWYSFSALASSMLGAICSKVDKCSRPSRSLPLSTAALMSCGPPNDANCGAGTRHIPRSVGEGSRGVAVGWMSRAAAASMHRREACPHAPGQEQAALHAETRRAAQPSALNEKHGALGSTRAARGAITQQQKRASPRPVPPHLGEHDGDVVGARQRDHLHHGGAAPAPPPPRRRRRGGRPAVPQLRREPQTDCW